MATVTTKEIRYFQRFHRTKSAAQIAAELGHRHSPETLTAAYENFRERIRKSFPPAGWNSLGLRDAAVPVRPPGRIREEWQARLALRPASITVAVCGDPLPGHSALDRRGESVRSDG